MCLETVSEKIPKHIKYGYKTFVENPNGELSPECKDFYKPYKVGEWIEDTNPYDIWSNSKSYYKSGFHAFTNKKDAKKWNAVSHQNFIGVYKVEIKDPVAYGKQFVGYKSHNLDFVRKYGNAIVVRKMKILERIN